MYDALDAFIKKAKTANAMGSKEVRLSIAETVDLALEINEILTTITRVFMDWFNIHHFRDEIVRFHSAKCSQRSGSQNHLHCHFDNKYLGDKFLIIDYKYLR